VSLAKRLLGYEPEVGFDEGLRRTLDWYRASEGSASRGPVELAK
jgi:nucleoside-diphosphate-sugar epimerase